MYHYLFNSVLIITSLPFRTTAISLPTPVEDQAINFIEAAYEQRLTTSTGIADFGRTVTEVTQGLMIDTAKAAEENPTWFNKSQIDSERDLWKKIGDTGGGGCSTLAVMLCLRALGQTTTAATLGLEKTGEGTRPFQVVAFMRQRNFASILKILLPNCDTYEDIESWQRRGCQITIDMRTNTRGHHEFLNLIFISKRLNQCWGITNSWGSAALIGAGGQFMHSVFSEYDGSEFVFYNVVCPSSPTNVEAMIESALSDPTTFEDRDTFASLIELLMAERSLVEVLKLLMERNIDLNRKIYRRTLLEQASSDGNIKLVRDLLSLGVDPHKAMPGGRASNAFMIAVKERHREVMELLRNAPGKDGATPLHFAAKEGKASMVRILLITGADPHKVDNNRWTPLMEAAREGNKAVVELLLVARSNVHASGNAGKSALYLAAQEGHGEIIPLLLAAGADPNQARADGMTPLLIAEHNGFAKIVDLLKGGAFLEQVLTSEDSPMGVASDWEN